MTSTVEWHRYGDKQPEPWAEVRVQRGKQRLITAVYIHLPGFQGNRTVPHWNRVLPNDKVARRSRPIIACRPSDLWCYLPTPPEGGEA